MTKEKKKDYFIFFAGLAGTFSLHVLGTFYIIEIIAFLSYIIIPWRKYKAEPQMKKLISMAFLWLLGAVIADFWNHTSLVDSVKGWFNIIFFIGLMPFVYWALEDKPTRWLWYVAGNGISTLASFYLVKSVEMDRYAYDIWQIYSWGPIVIAIASVLYFTGRRKIAMFVYLGWGVFSLYSGSRNGFLNTAMAVCIMYMVEKSTSFSVTYRIGQFRKRLVTIILSMLMGGMAISMVYENLASTGVLGDAAYEKYMKQKVAGGNILKGGRAETFLGLDLALENPIIGYGSFSKYSNSLDISSELRTELLDYYGSDDNEILPAHSHIVGYWVMHGILGFMFWLYVLILMWRLFKTGAFIYEPKMIGHCVYYSVAVMWSICFSPFGQRAPMAFYLAYLIVVQSYYLKDRYHQIKSN